jgi:hypothetical protein
MIITVIPIIITTAQAVAKKTNNGFTLKHNISGCKGARQWDCG